MEGAALAGDPKESDRRTGPNEMIRASGQFMGLGLTWAMSVLLFLGVVQIGCAYALFVLGLKHVTATEASLTGMLEPIFNPIWVFLFIGERPSAYSLLGGAIVLGAVAWRTLTAGRAGNEAISARVAPTD